MVFRTYRILPVAVLLAATLARGQDKPWRPLTPMPTARYGLTAAALDGKIYVIGGRAADHDEGLRTVEVYDPVTDTWETGVDSLRERRFNAASVAFDGKIWLLGGREGDDVLDKVEIFDPVLGRWEEGPELKRGREGLSAVVVSDTLYAVGGFGKNGNPVPEAEFYDTSRREWRKSANWRLMVPRVASATVVVRDSAITMGGVNIVPLAVVERFHPLAGVAMLAPMLSARADFAAAAVGDSIYVFGGFGQAQGLPKFIAEVERYIPSQGKWSVVSALEVPRGGLAAAVVDRRVYLFGGRTADGLASDLAEEFMPTITAVSTRPTSVPRSFVLRQNYPNPFFAEQAQGAGAGRTTGTSVNFVLKGSAPLTVRLDILNVRGQVVRTLVQRPLAPGEHTVHWDGRDESGRLASSGVYLYRLVAGSERLIRKMTLIR